jgi:hypothetical protein
VVARRDALGLIAVADCERGATSAVAKSAWMPGTTS